MNIYDKSAIRECTSCQMCAAVCPTNAITIKLNEDGFYRPYLNENTCTDCSLCSKVCYKFDNGVKVTTAEDFDKVEVHSAQLMSPDILKHVTSGGVANSLAKELISQGYVCIGVTYNIDNHRAEHKLAHTSSDTDAFRGSKYIQSYSLDAFKTLVKNVRNTRFAVFGLPCHIYAVHQFLAIRKLRDNCILIDLFCHGCPSMLVWTKYEECIKRLVANKRFDNIQFRSKAKGWGAYNLSVNIDGREAFISNPSHDEFYTLFFSDYVLNDACGDCKLRSTLAYSDIRLGDFWGKRYLSDKKGVSAVVIISERGKKLFKNIQAQFRTENSSMREVLAHQSYGRTYSPNIDIRKQMLESLRDVNQSLKDTVVIYERYQGFLYKLKKIVKMIDWYLPFDITRLLKRLV